MTKRDTVPLEGARAAVSEIIERSGLKLSALSTAIGRNPTYLQQWIRYAAPALLPERDRHALARELRVSEEKLREENQPGASGFRQEPELIGKLDLKVYAAVEGGPGEILVSSEAIDVVRRPWFLERVGEAFAVVVTGDSMEPVYEPGDIVLVNPKLPLIRGKDAIFTSERFGGDFKASIKRFVRATPEAWVARQFSPAPGQNEEVIFEKASWNEALRVVGKYTP